MGKLVYLFLPVFFVVIPIAVFLFSLNYSWCHINIQSWLEATVAIDPNFIKTALIIQRKKARKYSFIQQIGT